MNALSNSLLVPNVNFTIEQNSKELVSILKTILADTNELFLKSNNLLELLLGPAYAEARLEVENCCNELTLTLPLFYEAMLNANLDASKIACSLQLFATPKYTGWIDRVRELTTIHQKIRINILAVFMNFNELDFPEVFKYLKIRLAIHEKYIWNFRAQLD